MTSFVDVVALGRPVAGDDVRYALITSQSSVGDVTSSPASSDGNWTTGDSVTSYSSGGGGNMAAKAIVLGTIMTSAVVGNLLVVVSVLRYDRLRRVANSFIVSLAFADLLVAVLVMPFNASQIIAGRWVFGRLTCDMFNANDVLFSTASLLHLCCISMDRYIAVTDPFNYTRRMTRPRAALTLVAIWTASACLSHIPIHLGLYTTDTQRDKLATDTDECSFKVNRAYGIISSTVSFWTPAVVMIFTYVKIYREARRQEMQIAALARTLPPPPPSPRLPARSSSRAASTLDLVGAGGGNNVDGGSNGGGGFRSSMLNLDRLIGPKSDIQRRPSELAMDGQRQRLSTERRMMRREHKAAKTLGVIMGAFLVCWLPFFTWYLTATLCDDACPELPEWGVSVLFWIGYANSALNPIIYPCFNRDFRDAFRRLLAGPSGCCCCCGRDSMLSSSGGRFSNNARGSIGSSNDATLRRISAPQRKCLAWLRSGGKTSAGNAASTCLTVASERTRLKTTVLHADNGRPTIPMITITD